MEYRKLGRTDIEVSVVAMGCWALAGGRTWGPQVESDSMAAIRAALDVGVTLFDTAEGYGAGESERVLGQALGGHRHDVVIATKASRANLSGDEVQRACERSLKHLQTDYIDLYQVHWPSRTVPLEETMAALGRLKEQGKVRAIGVCNFGVKDLDDLFEIGWAEANQVPYSLLWRAIEYEIQPKCVEKGMGILCYSSLAMGLLTGKFSSPDDVPEGRARLRFFSGDRPLARHGEPGCETEAFAAIEALRRVCDGLGEPMAAVAVAWLLHQPGVTSVIAGARRAGQIEQTARAADLVLSPEIVDRLTEATDEVKRAVGSNPDMWQSESRFR
jgi:myo-inositol catabolism protein IolS